MAESKIYLSSVLVVIVCAIFIIISHFKAFLIHLLGIILMMSFAIIWIIGETTSKERKDLMIPMGSN